MKIILYVDKEHSGKEFPANTKVSEIARLMAMDDSDD